MPLEFWSRGWGWGLARGLDRQLVDSPFSPSASSPSRSQMTVMGLLRIRLRALYLLLAAEGGVRDRPYFIQLREEDGEDGEERVKPSLRFHSSTTLLLRPGEVQGLCSIGGEDGEARGGSRADSERVLWKRGSVERSISAADIRKLVSERLPFFRSRALKVSLLVADLRRFRWMEPLCRGSEDTRHGDIPVGVAGGDCGWLPPCDLSSSDSLRPRTFLLDLGEDVESQVRDMYGEGQVNKG